MIVVMKPHASEAQIDAVRHRLEGLGLGVHLSRGSVQTVVGAIGDTSVIPDANLESYEGVERVVAIRHPFKRVSRDFHPDNSLVRVGDVVFGGEHVVVIGGPCSVEGRDEFLAAAQAVKAAGAQMLRGGAYKPRTSPYSFQGLEEEGLKIMAEAREQTGLPVVTEVISPELVGIVAEYSDMLQIGARNCQNYPLLREVGKSGKPVLLKRGLAVTIEEWLMAAEYVLAAGNSNVVLCERGIRTFETATRNTLDLNAVPVVKNWSHLPIVVDPSHGTGKRDYVTPMARAAVAAGADGLIVEMHPMPEKALSDGAQSLTPAGFADLVRQVARMGEALGRGLPAMQVR